MSYLSRCNGSIDLKLPGAHNFRRWTFYGIGSIYIKRLNKIWLFLAKTFSVFGPFQAVALTQSLRYCQVHTYGWWAFLWCKQNCPSI